MRTFKLTLAYQGTDFVGWQRQTNGVSIQQLVEEAFIPLVGAAPTVEGASRTDAGVHATGQVASVALETTLEPGAVQRALNVRLNPAIRAMAAEEAPPGFHARHHARGKTYRYRIATGPVLSPFDRWFAWHEPRARDLHGMRAAAALLAGTHDFASFQASGTSIVDTTRTVMRLDIETQGDAVVIEVEGDGFLRHMVRAIAGTLVDVGCGARTPASMADVLAAGDRRAAGPTAPAAGLTLVAVRYDAWPRRSVVSEE